MPESSKSGGKRKRDQADDTTKATENEIKIEGAANTTEAFDQEMFHWLVEMGYQEDQLEKNFEKTTGFKNMRQAKDFKDMMDDVMDEIRPLLWERYHAGESPKTLIAEGRANSYQAMLERDEREEGEAAARDQS